MKKSIGDFFQRYQKHLWFFSIIFLVVLLDQLSKYLMRTSFLVNRQIIFIRGLFNLTLVQNTGAGFGFFQGRNSWLIVISLVVITFILFNYKKIKFEDKLLFFSTALVLSGAIGNLLDRLILGYVVDFLDFIYWPAFNLADICVSIGVVGLIIYFWKKK